MFSTINSIIVTARVRSIYHNVISILFVLSMSLPIRDFVALLFIQLFITRRGRSAATCAFKNTIPPSPRPLARTHGRGPALALSLSNAVYVSNLRLTNPETSIPRPFSALSYHEKVRSVKTLGIDRVAACASQLSAYEMR